MPAITRLVAFACSGCVIAWLIPQLVMSATAAKPTMSIDTHSDQAIKNFFAYHGTASPPQETAHIDHDPACKPCAAKAAALKAGGVPAKPPPEKVDQPYQRITGRLPTYEPPTHQGTITITMPRSIEAWVSLSYGMPFEQIRCRAVITEQGVTVSALNRMSVKDDIIAIRWHEDPTARLGQWAAYLKNGAQDLWQLSKLMSSPIETGKNYGRYHAQAVGPGKVFFMASSQKLFCDDVEMRLDERGKPISMTHLQATAAQEPFQAARQIWLLIDKP